MGKGVPPISGTGIVPAAVFGFVAKQATEKVVCFFVAQKRIRRSSEDAAFCIKKFLSHERKDKHEKVETNNVAVHGGRYAVFGFKPQRICSARQRKRHIHHPQLDPIFGQ